MCSLLCEHSLAPMRTRNHCSTVLLRASTSSVLSFTTTKESSRAIVPQTRAFAGRYNFEGVVQGCGGFGDTDIVHKPKN